MSCECNSACNTSFIIRIRVIKKLVKSVKLPQDFGIWRRNLQSALFEKNMEF